ncbi:MAG TPA: hypothetical protein VE956_07565 [Nodularia sp. (in: cyanobacteria)]|nr:hypothetical protein [Nodularia sp. (in: cyanobacteria)]
MVHGLGPAFPTERSALGDRHGNAKLLQGEFKIIGHSLGEF